MIMTTTPRHDRGLTRVEGWGKAEGSNRSRKQVVVQNEIERKLNSQKTREEVTKPVPAWVPVDLLVPRGS